MKRCLGRFWATREIRWRITYRRWRWGTAKKNDLFDVLFFDCRAITPCPSWEKAIKVLLLSSDTGNVPRVIVAISISSSTKFFALTFGFIFSNSEAKAGLPGRIVPNLSGPGHILASTRFINKPRWGRKIGDDSPLSSKKLVSDRSASALKKSTAKGMFRLTYGSAILHFD